MDRRGTTLWDLDGTLLYTIEDLAIAVNAALSEYQYPTHPMEKIGRMVGNGVGLLIARALPDGRDNPDYDAVFAAFRAYYSAHCEEHTYPYDGMVALLQTLHDEGYLIGVVSNKYQSACEKLMARYFPGLIDLVIGDHPTHRRKPAPDAVLHALETLQADASHAVYIGDTEVDFETAKNAHLPGICVTWGYRTQSELEAQEISPLASDPTALLRLIRETI